MNDSTGEIRIAHLSDLHFDPMEPRDIGIVIRALTQSLAQARNDGFDLVIFSGDLVKKGESIQAYAEIRKLALDPICQACNTRYEQLIICPGNHDVDRKIVRAEEWVEAGLLSTLKERSSINEFLDHLSASSTTERHLAPPIQRLQNFYTAIWNIENSNRIHHSPFLQLYRFTIRGTEVGVACFNTAWRATGEPNDRDRRHLILGEAVVDTAAAALNGCAIKLAVFHHPTDWLVDSDQSAVEGRLQTEFDILFCGHIHRASPEFRKTTTGEAIVSQAGCLYSSREYFNGFSIINLAPESGSAIFTLYEYSDHRRQFVPAVRIADEGRVELTLPVRNGGSNSALPTLLRKIRPAVRRLANEHISLTGAAVSAQRDMETHFVCPPLASRWEAASTAEPNSVGSPRERRSEDKDELESIDEILNCDRNVIILGRPESGKTSVAHYAAIRCATSRTDKVRLPLYGRFATIRPGSHILWRLVKDYAVEISDGLITRQIVETEPKLVIIDEVNVFDAERVRLLNELIQSTANARWMLFAQIPPSASPEGSVAQAFPSFDVHTIRELSRGSIRMLSAQWLASSRETEETDALFRSVMDHIEHAGLPRSGYIVSLILWAIRNKSQGEILNEAVLIQNIVDYILGRMDYTGALRSEFDFTSKTAVLQHLAHQFKQHDDIVETNKALQLIIDFLERKGLKYDASEILKGFIQCGILHKLQDSISFRYKRFQEFFTAGFLRDNKSAFDEVIKDHNWVGYRREIDIFSARFRHEDWLLEFAVEKMKENPFAEPPLKGKELSDYLASGPAPDYTQTRLRKMRTEPLTAEKIDEVIDRTERGMAKQRERHNRPDRHFENDLAVIRAYSAIEMHSQLVRNLEFVDRDIKRVHLRTAMQAWEKLLRGWLSIFKITIAEVREDLELMEKEDLQSENRQRKKKTADTTIQNIVDYIESELKTMMPTILAHGIYHNLASEKLVELLDEVAAELPVDSLGRMLFTFVLLEIDLERAIDRIKQDKQELVDERWMTAAVAQRLYAYYRSRPVAPNLRPKFEGLIADLELSLEGLTANKQRRGRLLQGLKKQAYRDKPLDS